MGSNGQFVLAVSGYHVFILFSEGLCCVKLLKIICAGAGALVKKGKPQMLPYVCLLLSDFYIFAQFQEESHTQLLTFTHNSYLYRFFICNIFVVRYELCCFTAPQLVQYVRHIVQKKLL